MAHVLLPCDLPFWPDVLKHLSQVKTCSDVTQLVQLMAHIYHICWMTLDPEEEEQPQMLRELECFLKDGLSDEERTQLLRHTLPDMAAHASRLPQLRPRDGFLYSLRCEERTFQLERDWIASLLANAFFSTFPRRTTKTHPTLHDFSFAYFFPHLYKRNHQKKLRLFFRYFETFESGGIIKFARKVATGPSLPAWLCSDSPLLPFTVQTEERIEDSKALRACSFSPLIGGDVLNSSTSRESKLLFRHPELLVTLSFVESLYDSEVLLIEGIDQGLLEYPGIHFCFSDFSSDKLEDQFLLRELNKALVVFGSQLDSSSNGDKAYRSRQDKSCSRSLSKGSSCSKGSSFAEKSLSKESLLEESSLSKESSFGERSFSKGSFEERSLSKESSFGERSLSKGSSIGERNLSKGENIFLKGSSDDNFFGIESKVISYRNLKSSFEKASKHLRADNDKRKNHVVTSSKKFLASKSSSHSSGRSLKTGSLRDEEYYYTADEDSEDGGSNSVGFVLGEHERLDDFRKRIRKRTRRRISRRRSSSSYMSSSSDMEDISEENPEEIKYIRVATSEPSIITALKEEEQPTEPMVCQEAETLLLRGRKMMVVSSNGRLKAYSYDGVNPNLPVPFKAKFRRRKLESCSTRRKVVVLPSEMSQLKAIILWLASSMADTELELISEEFQEMSKIYSKVVNRGWTTGDLSCEVLRFCRNSLSTRNRTDLFNQLMGKDTSSLG